MPKYFTFQWFFTTPLSWFNERRRGGIVQGEINQRMFFFLFLPLFIVDEKYFRLSLGNTFSQEVLTHVAPLANIIAILSCLLCFDMLLSFLMSLLF